MLAEKFFLALETLISHVADGGPVVVSSAPHVPVGAAVQETGLISRGAGRSSGLGPDEEASNSIP